MPLADTLNAPPQPVITAATRDTPATVVTAALDRERLIPIVEQAFALLAAGFPAG